MPGSASSQECLVRDESGMSSAQCGARESRRIRPGDPGRIPGITLPRAAVVPDGGHKPSRVEVTEDVIKLFI